MHCNECNATFVTAKLQLTVHKAKPTNSQQSTNRRTMVPPTRRTRRVLKRKEINDSPSTVTTSSAAATTQANQGGSKPTANVQKKERVFYRTAYQNYDDLRTISKEVASSYEKQEQRRQNKKSVDL